MLSNLLHAIAALPRSLQSVPEPRLVMTLLVKNEEAMLERNLIFHRAMGVDAFIVTDNGSTDGTLDILERYRQKGWVVDIIHERATGYEQKAWVDRMIRLARDRYDADWVINADADEFWRPATGTLKDALRAATGNVLACEMRSVYPEEGQPWTAWEHTVRYVPDQGAYDLSRFSIFERQNKKVAHRTAGYLQISMGNHKVKMLPQRERRSDIIVLHYNVRTREAFIAKMINGGQQLLTHRGRHGGRHWRYFYALHEQGRLAEEYDRVLGTAQRHRLEADGYIRHDNPMPAWFAQNGLAL